MVFWLASPCVGLPRLLGDTTGDGWIVGSLDCWIVGSGVLCGRSWTDTNGTPGSRAMERGLSPSIWLRVLMALSSEWNTLLRASSVIAAIFSWWRCLSNWRRLL